MKIIIVANVEQQEEVLLKKTNEGVEIIFVKKIQEITNFNECDALFILNEYENINLNKFLDKPVFINSVTKTLEQNNLQDNFSRINGWPGFLKRQIWEIASPNKSLAGKVFEQLSWEIIFVKDEPGFIAARVISMIINEAFFALEDEVSSMEEIDLAMKLGTNYLFGPFEWLEKIGVQNIYHLLQKLTVTDIRYSIAPLLEKKYFETVASL